MKRVVGNWKMHLNKAQAHDLAQTVESLLQPGDACVLCPPTIHLPALIERFSALAWGAQDCHWAEQGAYTGDISAPMLADAGTTYVLVGHSERRQYHKEDDATVHRKAAAALNTGLIPILCIGETLEERESGQAEAVVARQLVGLAPGVTILAYEPVWAIGTGKTATQDDIAAMHAHIHAIVGRPVEVLYGGSVKAENAEQILATAGVDGVLVGGASLKAPEFATILAAGRAF